MLNFRRAFYPCADIRYVGFDFGWGKPIFGGVPKAISVISFGVKIKNDKGEKGILIAINLPPQAMEKLQEVIYKTLRNVKESI
ncbi:hypothetical protein H5410_039713 [Solanum commersonii]|uniref:Uncharacterized protein n=1 Tax=Solanum commersonii TaxID=4109 RepID=A0A9J5XNX7_SOLCO|nr:hypothetical protein H5410_039713 [Solanum commersonii]